MAIVVLIIIGGDGSTASGPDVDVIRMPVAHDSNADSLQQDLASHAKRLKETRELRAKELEATPEEHISAKHLEDN